MKRNYEDKVYADWRLAVFKRDKFRCQMPSCKNKKGLNAHHIHKWSTASTLRYDVFNGITLCYSCHKKVTGHEHLYIGVFEDINRRKKH
jgi:5-methylcytosine-specific restriction endonuclease McrA